MRKIEREPETKITFGKHKGKSLNKLPVSYLEWLFSIVPSTIQENKRREFKHAIKRALYTNRLKWRDMAKSHLYSEQTACESCMFHGEMAQVCQDQEVQMFDTLIGQADCITEDTNFNRFFEIRSRLAGEINSPIRVKPIHN